MSPSVDVEMQMVAVGGLRIRMIKIHGSLNHEIRRVCPVEGVAEIAIDTHQTQTTEWCAPPGATGLPMVMDATDGELPHSETGTKCAFRRETVGFLSGTAAGL